MTAFSKRDELLAAIRRIDFEGYRLYGHLAVSTDGQIAMIVLPDDVTVEDPRQ